MKTDRRTIGQFGEKKAQNYLKRRGYRILECNFRTRGGELDIIAKDRECIVFVEVKTRTNSAYGNPADAVSVFKQKNMMTAAKYYLSRRGFDLECRFDVIEVRLAKKWWGFYTTVNHYKNVIQ